MCGDYFIGIVFFQNFAAVFIAVEVAFDEGLGDDAGQLRGQEHVVQTEINLILKRQELLLMNAVS